MIDRDYAGLLNRPEKPFDEAAISRAIKGKRILVTGAGGSIGSALSLRIAHADPGALVLVGHGEGSIFDTTEWIKDRFEHASKQLPQIHSLVADARSQQVEDYLDQNVEIVFHAAAVKHVGLMEGNPLAAFDNNVQQTIWLARQCKRRGIKFVFISTDKAVNPSSVMGASKRIAEAWLETNFPEATICRFGNVLGSSGSLIPIIKRRLAEGLPIQITDGPAGQMKRYFITVREAAGLVLTAGLLFEPGKYCLEMGDPIPIFEIIVKLSPKGTRIESKRPTHGEKLSEELWDRSRGARAYRTNHPEIFGIREYTVHAPLVSAVLEILEDHANANRLTSSLLVEMARKV